MNKKQFEGLLVGVRQMNRHMRGKTVARATTVDSTKSRESSVARPVSRGTLLTK